jgi:hypothetical protein
MQDDCAATALVDSGRPDPEWRVSNHEMERLHLMWAGLPPTQHGPPPPPSVGYRGCAIRCGVGEEWFAFSGVVMFTRGGAIVSLRSDARRAFEMAMLATAPPGLLPPDLV